MIYEHEREERKAPRVQPAPENISMPDLDPKHWITMTRYLDSRGLDFRLAVENGWYPSTEAGDTSPRVVIPCHPHDLRFWQARALDASPKRYQSPHRDPAGAVVVVFPVHAPRGVVVLEGPMDALAAAELGFLGVALMGATPSAARLRTVARIIRRSPPRVIVIPDTDAVNEARNTRLRLAILAEHVIELVIPPEGRKDLGECSRAERRKLLGL